MDLGGIILHKNFKKKLPNFFLVLYSPYSSLTIEYLVKSHKKESRKEMFWKRFFSNYPEGEKSAQPPLQHIDIIKEKVGVQ